MSNAVQNRGDDSVRSLFESMKDKMAEVLPKHLTPERLVKTALIALNKTPQLHECTRGTLAQSLMTAAELGLDVSGTLGSAYLIPFRNTKTGKLECQLIVGYRGMIDLARRSGNISTIEAHCVCENDTFSVRLGTDSGIEHVPNFNGDRGKMVAVYAVAKLVDGGMQFDVMTRADVEKIRQKSKGKNLAPWVDYFDEMAKKTVVRRLFKYLPSSVETDAALAHLAEVEEVQDVIRDVTPAAPRASSQDKLANRLGLTPAPAAAAEPVDIDPDTGEIVPPPREDGDLFGGMEDENIHAQFDH